jgi:hypothetical protein
MRRAGLEWAFRLGREPKRLWNRYVHGNPLFLRPLAAAAGDGAPIAAPGLARGGLSGASAHGGRGARIAPCRARTTRSTSSNSPTPCGTWRASGAPTRTTSSGKPFVYVGMTGLDPDIRFDKHKAGIQSNRFVQQWGVRLRPELYEHHNPMPYDDARLMEVEVGIQLRRLGWGSGRAEGGVRASGAKDAKVARRTRKKTWPVELPRPTTSLPGLRPLRVFASFAAGTESSMMGSNLINKT